MQQAQEKVCGEDELPEHQKQKTMITICEDYHPQSSDDEDDDNGADVEGSIDAPTSCKFLCYHSTSDMPGAQPLTCCMCFPPRCCSGVTAHSLLGFSPFFVQL